MPPEKTRTTHVRRITNADNPDIWIDVERVDKLPSTEGQGPGFKKTTRKMFWADEGDDAGHPTRTLTEKRIEDPTDEDNYVLLNVIDKKKTQRGQGPGYLKSTKKYRNDRETNTAREVTIRRVYHWDTNGDPNNDGGTNYERIDGTKDEEQYIDVAVIEKLIATSGQGPSFKKRTFKFNTDPIKEFSEEPPDDVDMSKVVYLDPWQNIINVSWVPEDPYLIVKFRYRTAPREDDHIIGFHGVNAALPPFVTGPLNSTYSISVVLRTEAFIGFDDVYAEDSPYQVSGFPPHEELIGAPGFFPGGFETYFPSGESSGGTHEFISRHSYTPGGPLPDEEDAEQTASLFEGLTPFTDSFSIEYTMYTDIFTGDTPVRMTHPGEEILYPSTSGQNETYDTRSWDFSGATIFVDETENTPAKTFRAIGAVFQERAIQFGGTDRRNGPLYILFKHDPESD